MLNQLLDGLQADSNMLGMHLVVTNLLALYGFKGAGTYVKGQLLALYAVGIEVGQYAFCEMKSCRWSGHRSLNLGIDGLIGTEVALFGLTIQVGRNGQFSQRLQHLGEGKTSFPAETYLEAGAMRSHTLGRNGISLSVYLKRSIKQPFFPLLGVAYQTIPGTFGSGNEVFLIFYGESWLQ